MDSAKKHRGGSGSGSGGVHSTAAGSSTGGGRQHSTATAMEPAKKRRVDSGTSTAAGPSTGGGSQQSNATTSLLFADAGLVHDNLKDHLMAGSRQAPDESVMDQIKEVVTEFAPDIYVKPALIKTENTDWQLEATDDWEEVSREYVPLQKVNASLYTAYDGCLTTLRRLTPCKSILKLFLVRIPRCKQNSTRYRVNQANRADIGHTIFALLAKEKAPFIVIGNLGFALASCLRFLWQFEEKTVIQLEDQLQIVYSRDQELVCIFKNEEGQSIQQKGFAGTPECLCIDISWTGNDVSQHDAQTGGMSSGVTQSTEHTRREHYLTLLSTAENVEEFRGRLATLLLRPVVSSTSEPDATGVIDVNATLETLDNSFNLLKRARAHAGVVRDNKTLNDAQFEAAHEWLLEKFKTHFIQNVDLQNRIHNASVDSVLTRQEKEKLREDMRNAFKVWKCSLLGNHQFLMAVLRNGLFDTQSQQDLMTAVLQEQSQSGDDHPAEHDRQKRRRKALEARKN